MIMKRIPSFVAVLVLLAGCGAGGPLGTSHLKVQLTDAPASEATSLTVAFGRIELVPADEDAAPITVTEEGGSIDVLELRNGGLELLGALDIPAGTYTQIRIIVDSAEIAFGEAVYDVKVPSGPQTGLKIDVEPPLSAAAGETSLIVLDFDAERAVIETPPGSGNYLLKPTGIRAVTASGTVQGRVLSAEDETPIGGATVDVYGDEGTLLSSTVTEAGGGFKFITLLEGSYDLEFSAEGYESLRAEDVAVAAGETSDLGAVLLAPVPAEPQ